MSLELVLNKIFFTEIDDSISGKSQRDPLGFQPIWSYYGRQVINHLTTVSTSIHGFREVLLCLSICNDIKDSFPNIKLPELILYFEQLFIYTAIKQGKVDGILGADNGKIKFKEANKNPQISPNKSILVRQISLGYYGRYKTPLLSMGIIDGRSQIQIESDEIKNLYGEKEYSEVLKKFSTFLKGNKSFEDFEKQDTLYNLTFGKFREGERDFWENRLKKVNEEEKELMELCYENISSNSNIDTFFQNQKISEYHEVSNILKLEPFLRCLEEVFYKALTSKDIESIKIENKEEHKIRFDKFREVSIPNEDSLLKKRVEFIIKNCSPENDDYEENVIDYHKEVCKQKKCSVWVEKNTSGNLQSFVHTETSNININEWGRDYYLSSLSSVKSEIEEFSNEEN